MLSYPIQPIKHSLQVYLENFIKKLSFVQKAKNKQYNVKPLQDHCINLLISLALFSASSNSDSASSKCPMCMQQTALPLRINPVIWYFSEKSWKIRYASCILEPPWIHEKAKFLKYTLQISTLLIFKIKMRKCVYHCQV